MTTPARAIAARSAGKALFEMAMVQIEWAKRYRFAFDLVDEGYRWSMPPSAWELLMLSGPLGGGHIEISREPSRNDRFLGMPVDVSGVREDPPTIELVPPK